MKLLLAEDDAMLGQGMDKGLRQAGMTVDWVRDGPTAQAALQTQTYDVLTEEYLDTRAATRAAPRAGKPVDMIVVRGIVNPEDYSDTQFLPVLPVTSPAPES